MGACTHPRVVHRRVIAMTAGPQRYDVLRQLNINENFTLPNDVVYSSAMTTVKDKAAYVRKAKQTRSHTCHWPLCRTEIPPAMHMCKPHWFTLPVSLRNKLWSCYKIGQEETGRVSPDYLAAMDEVQRWITTHYPHQGVPS